MNKTKLLAIGAIIVAVGIGSISLHSFVTAQDTGQGLTVSPPSQEVTIDPGKTTIVKAKIRNNSNNTLPMQVHIEDFTAKGDAGQIALNSNSPYSVASWTKVSPSSFSLPAGSEQEVTATITAPANAAGGHFGSFVFAVQADKSTGNTASVTQEIASLFLVRVSGPIDEKLDLTSLSAPSYSEFGPVTFDMKFKNSGNVYTKTYGLINVTDMFGNKVADIVVRGVNIFPDSDRIVQASLDKKFLIGNYHATALLYYGTQTTQSLTASTTFFVFPTRIAVIIIVILAVLYLMRKRLKKALKALGGK